MSQSPTPIRRGADARDTEAFAKQIAANLLTQNDALQPASPVPETKKPLIEMHGIRKSYYIGKPNELEILHGIDLTVYPGEFVAIVGESGSGKSTLMNIIGVLDKPTAGEYTLDGVNIHDAKDNQLADIRNRKIGFVFQFYNLIPNLTAIENVEIASQLSKDPLDSMAVMKQVGLADRALNFPAQLSGGEQQRVAIARALAKNPKLLLCDEPTGALDYETGKAILKLLQDTCRKSGMTVVIITHNSALTAMADRVVKIKNGTVASVSINENPESIENIEW